MNFPKFFQVYLLNIFLISQITAGEKENSEPEVHIEGRINYLANKTVKILNTQNRPPPPQPPPHHQQAMMNHYPNQYPQPNIQYPQSPDLAGSGSGPQPSFQQPRPQESPPVPEVYMQIIGAIEKLVGRMDKLDSRLQTLENIVLHLTNKKDEKEKPVQGNCPGGFVKIEGIRGKCYHVSTLPKKNDGAVISSGFELFDWKHAHAECKKMGGRLAEMFQYDDFLRISQFLVKYSELKNNGQASTDFWIGGINPGLIWIWSDTGHKVGMDRRFWNENDNASNAPGCLKLSYSHRLDSFFFKGAPCSHTQNIVCEIMDNSVSRALAQFEQEIDDTFMNEENN